MALQQRIRAFEDVPTYCWDRRLLAFGLAREERSNLRQGKMANLVGRMSKTSAIEKDSWCLKTHGISSIDRWASWVKYLPALRFAATVRLCPPEDRPLGSPLIGSTLT